MAEPNYGYQPEWRGQLTGEPQSSVNCGVVATGRAIDMQTKGKVKPGTKTVRVRMNALTGPTNMWDVDRAIDSYDTEKELPDPFLSLRGRRETDGGPDATWEKVLDWLPDGSKEKRGRSIVMGVSYGVLRRLAPRRTGSETFDGWHGITLTAVRTRRGVTQVKVYDALNDGRYRGCPGPGAVWIAAHKVRDAAFVYGKAVHGKAKRIAGVFCPPGIVAVVDPEPEPPDPCEVMHDGIVDAIAELMELADGLTGAPKTAVDGIIDDLRDTIPHGVGGGDDLIEEGMAVTGPPAVGVGG